MEYLVSGQEQPKTQTVYTMAQFVELSPEGKLYELVEGDLIEVAPVNEEHSRFSNRLNAYLSYYILENGLGDTYGAHAVFRIGRDALSPDMAFIEKGRLSSEERGLTLIPIPPDLVVEVLVNPNTRLDIRRKVQKYQQVGVRLVWVILPKRELVEVYYPETAKPVTLGLPDELNGEDVVPGFKLSIKKLFKTSE
jgi:Uma2 family endonuclease